MLKKWSKRAVRSWSLVKSSTSPTSDMYIASFYFTYIRFVSMLISSKQIFVYFSTLGIALVLILFFSSWNKSPTVNSGQSQIP